MTYLAQFFLEWEMLQKNIVEKIKIHCLRSATFFNYVIYEIMWKNMVEPDRPQMTM